MSHNCRSRAPAEAGVASAQLPVELFVSSGHPGCKPRLTWSFCRPIDPVGEEMRGGHLARDDPIAALRFARPLTSIGSPVRQYLAMEKIDDQEEDCH